MGSWFWVSIAAIVILTGLTVFFMVKWLKLRSALKKDNVEEEIISMVDEGQETGALEVSEAEMIHNIFEFGDKQTQDIMTNRSNIAAIDAQSTLAEAKNMMLELPYSRFPVYINDLDHIIGIIHLKDIVRYTDEDQDETKLIKNCKSLLRRAVFIPETKDVDDLFRKMQAERIQMAIVVDEYGQTSGLIAMEDLLEEIVGNIMDEYDIKDHLIGEKGKNLYEVDGLTTLEEIEDALGISLEVEEYETLNGFMTSRLKHVPTEEDVGFSFVYGGFAFRILSVEKHVIGKAQMKRVEEAASTDNADKSPSTKGVDGHTENVE